MKYLLFVGLVLTVNFVQGSDVSGSCAAETCIETPRHYIDLGCKPVIPSGGCCPTKFECPEYKKNSCYRSGREFAPAEKLPNDLLAGCTAACICTQYENRTKNSISAATFNCAHVDCAEFFGRRPNCVYQKSLGQCCSTNTVCGDDKKALSQCYYNNKQYYEGEIIYPEDDCMECLCTKNFDNSTIVNNENCRKVDCALDLHYLDRIRDNCVPVYYGTKRCCPIEWICPTDEYDIDEERSASANSETKCDFGEGKKISSGQTISTKNGCTKCTCEVGPILSCIKTPNCN